MSAGDKSKLNGIAAGANKTTILNSLAATTTGYALDAVQGKALNDKITAINNSLTQFTFANVASGIIGLNAFYNKKDKMMFVSFNYQHSSVSISEEMLVVLNDSFHVPDGKHYFSLSAWDTVTGNICLSYGLIYPNGDISIYTPKGVQLSGYANFFYHCK